MRVRAWLGICGVLATSAAVSAMALGQGALGQGGTGKNATSTSTSTSTPTPTPTPTPTSTSTPTWGRASSPNAPDASSPGRGLSTWGTASIPAPPSDEDGEDEDEDETEDAGPPHTDAAATEDASTGYTPSNVGLSVGIHGPGYGIPFGTANGNSLHDYVVSGMVPLGIDAGWFFTPRFYVGAYFTYGFGINAGYQNDQCNGTDDCQATIIQIGLAAHYHFRPEGTFDPWVGVGLGYEEIVFVGTSTDDGSTDLSHGLPAINASIQGGLDYKPLKYMGFGPYAELAGSSFVVTDSGLHGWLTLGLRFRTNL